MALSSVAMRNLVSPGLLSRSLRAPRMVPTLIASRFFYTSAAREYDPEHDVDVDRRYGRRVVSPFEGELFLFPESSSLSQIPKIVDQFMDSPISSIYGGNWDGKETEGGLILQVDLPGLGKDVEVWEENNTWLIRDEDEYESEEEKFSLSQTPNMMDQFVDSPMSSIYRPNWEAEETEGGLILRIDLPGLGKEDVKVWVESNSLVVKGEDENEAEEEEKRRRYSSRIDLPENVYKTKEIKAEMKNGVLKVMVPKIKQEERKDVFQVSVE